MPATLHPLVQQAIIRARASGATVDVASDFAAIAHLNDLAAALDHPDLETRLSILLAPVQVGNVTLRRLSLAAEEWLGEHADWFPSPRLEVMAIAYCMAHGRDCWLGMVGPKTAALRLRLWYLTVDVPFEALAECVSDLLPRKSEPVGGRPGSQEPGDAGCGSLVALLCREYGHTVDYWLFEAPADLPRFLIEGDFLPRRAAEERAYRAASGKVSAPRLTYQAMAHKRFVEASRAWIESKKPAGATT